MTDARESRLPKWAQELLEEERTRAALRWPQFPEPEPAAVYDANGYSSNRGRFQPGDRAWQVLGNDTVYEVRFAEDGRHINEGRGGSLSRSEGRFYATEDGARKALIWRVARQCAERLRKAGN